MPQTVEDIMSSNPVTLRESANLIEAAKAMRESDIGDVLVMNDQGLCGIVTDRDIVVRGLAEDRDPSSVSVGEICSRNVMSVRPNDDADQAVQMMREKAIRRLPVVEDGRPVGFVSLGDLAMERDEHSALSDISEAPPNR